MLDGMAYRVRFTGDPNDVLDHAGPFLASRPVEHNLIVSLLEARVARPTPGRYWIAEQDDEVVGVVFQSPTTYTASVTPMPPAAVDAAVAAIVEQGVTLPAVNGDAATSARFAGSWAERTQCPVRPDGSERIYVLETLSAPDRVDGTLRVADSTDRPRLIEWTAGFEAETGPTASPIDELVDERLAFGGLWLWETDSPVSMAGHRGPIVGVARIGPVYTPPPLRGRGYASACVAALARHLTSDGSRCLLYADLDNPVSNGIYQRLGFRSAAETIRFRFGDRHDA